MNKAEYPPGTIPDNRPLPMRDQTVTRVEGRDPIVHELKCHPGPYDATERGDKPFEFRKDDREPRFEAGDTLWLRRWDPELFEQVGEVSPARLVTVHDGYTGRECRRNVTYIIREGFGIPPGYCIMGLAPGSTEAPVVYTLEQVKAMLNDLHRSRLDVAVDDTQGGLVLQEFIKSSDIIDIAAKHGITI